MKRFLLLGLLIFLYSCGGGGGSGSTSLPPQNPPDTGGGGGTTGGVASIALTANPSSVTVKGTSSITATVLDSGGANVPDGTVVYFTLSDSSLGTITSQATTYNGNATATFTASDTPGTVTVKATSGNVSGSVNITITAAATGSLEFVSATPQVIGIKGSGQTETSTVKFLVKDINGNAILDGTSVSFTMNGPSGGKLPDDGGEYIGDSDSTPTTASGATVDGYATVTLHSGKVAGPVTIIATVTISGGTTLSSSSSQISIGGGVPSATHLNLATGQFNLAGLIYSNLETNISAFMADRFGNYNVLTGTTVSFYTEAGAIDRQGITDATGKTSVVIRTQAPSPVDVTPATAGDTVSNAFFGGINEPYYTSGGLTYNPRDGWLTVLATVQGEEAFNDANANGVYDSGESFTDLGEPFYDKNDDGCWNSGTTKNCNGVTSASTDPFEEYIDVNGNGSYDGPNGVWDGPSCPDAGCQTSKMIRDDIRLVFSGNYYYWPNPDSNNCYNLSSENPSCSASYASGCFAVAPSSITQGSSGSFTAIIGDANLNSLPGGTKIAASSTVGDVFPTDTTLIDGLSTGPTWFSFNVDIASTEKSSTTVGVTVTDTDGNKSSCYISVTVLAAPLIISTSSLPPGTIGASYSVTLVATGGTTPYTWTSGALPSGLSLDAASGVISGTPAGPAGTDSIWFRVYDSTGDSTSKWLSLTIN